MVMKKKKFHFTDTQGQVQTTGIIGAGTAAKLVQCD